MFDSCLLDSLLIRLFRFRTRGFMRMQPHDGTVPPRPEGGTHLYVHIPFCESLCPYCSFHRVQYHAGPARAYFAVLREEIRRYHAAGYAFTGAYFGGGTPTCDAAELIETIGLVRSLFGVREISVETNPRDLQPALLAALRDAGVTRLSVGVQSFDDRLLDEMERREKYGGGAEAVQRIRSAVSYFATVNVDLIFNQPHQSRASLQRDLRIFRTLGANQVSLYPLMASRTARPQLVRTMGLPDQRRLRQFYEVILGELAPDFLPTSAWCFTRAGQGSDEYLVTSEHYVGVGSGAFSYLDGTLYATSFSMRSYAHSVGAGHTGITACHPLSETERMRYTLLVKMFGLGLSRSWAEARHGEVFFRRLWPEIRSLELLGAARRTPAGWRLTPRGMFWLMLMMSEFFEAVNAYRDSMRAQVQAELEHLAQPDHLDDHPESAAEPVSVSGLSG